tara:strand:+ start:2076 stop:3548 length:1473 start_codon:yes stop_codon:yes gene_type:complete
MNDRDWTIARLRAAIVAKEVKAIDICDHFLNRIRTSKPELNAFTAVFEETARARAEEIDRQPNTWRDQPLLGVPIAVKDVICTRGTNTTGASRILSGFRPPYDATVVKRLQDAGAVIVGKTNCDEFAMGSSTEHSAYGPTHNPWSVAHTPGGSSGGSAAAVSARLCPASVASDTGGSIRQPAAFCGVVGLKPTYGRVSRYGLLAFASSLDQIGPMTLTVADAATVFQVIAGNDSFDATSVSLEVPDTESIFPGEIAGVRIGVPRPVLEGINDEVRQAFDIALETLVQRGGILVDIQLPHIEYAVPVYYLVAPAEASSNLARYDGVRYGFRAASKHDQADLQKMYERTRYEGFGPEVKRRIMLGTYALSAGYYDAYYLKAQRIRSLIKTDYEQAFQSVDAIAMPTTPEPAFQIGEHINDPLAMYLGDIFTVSANLTGLPALSVPAGFTSTRLPLGLQLMGRPFDEVTLLRIAEVYERESPWWQEHPFKQMS